MDRTSFLKAQPFLFPLESSVSWPPPLPAETSERSSCRRETLLRDFCLSIEPLHCLPVASEDRDRLSQQSINTSRGPAFFAPPNNYNIPSLNAAGNKVGADATSNDRNNFDPAMCSLELCVQSATLILPPHASPITYTENMSASFSNRFTSPTAYQKLLRQQQQHRHQHRSAAEFSSISLSHSRSNKPQIQESTIFLKMDNLVCQMDLSHVENVDVQYDDESDVSAMEDDNDICSTTTRPPSLLIQFGSSCLFRIFSLRGVNRDNLSTLKGVHNLLVQLLTADDQVPSEFPHQYFSSALASPAGSSTTAFSSSHEPGQRDFSRPAAASAAAETPPSHNNSGDLKSPPSEVEGSGGSKGNSSSSSAEGRGRDASTTNTLDGHSTTTTAHDQEESSSAARASGEKEQSASPSTKPPEQLSIVGKRQAAYEKSKTDLDSLNEILMRPHQSTAAVGSSANTGGTAEQNDAKRLRVLLQDQAKELFNSIPENLAASYCTLSQIQEVVQLQNERIHEYEVELDGLVNAFWPAPTRTAGGTSAAAGSINGLMNRQSSMDRRPQIESTECIRRANDLLQKHKDAIEEKFALSFLPTRGS